MHNVWHRAISSLIILLSGWVQAAPGTLTWQQEIKASEHQPVSVWRQENLPEQRFQRVRAEVTIKAPIGPLLALLQDASVQAQWMPYAHEVRVLERPTPLATLVYFRTQSRWPFKARDAVTLFEVKPVGPEQLRIDMLNQDEAIANQPGAVRIREAEGYWQLTARAGCSTLVRYESGSRWGGVVPQWLVDDTNAKLALEALTNLKQWAEIHFREYESYASLADFSSHRNCH